MLNVYAHWGDDTSILPRYGRDSFLPAGTDVCWTGDIRIWQGGIWGPTGKGGGVLWDNGFGSFAVIGLYSSLTAVTGFSIMGAR